MILNFFSSRGWQSWDVEHRPLIPEGMPVLIDDDLRFEDGPAAPRPTAVVNRWLRELPASGAPAPSSWENYARVVKVWMEFLAEHGVGLFDSRVRLKAALSRYAEHRAAGPLKARFAATTWGQHMSILSLFYRWAMHEEYATAEPFTYRAARALFAGTGREVKVNLAVRRTPKPHVTIKYLEPDFTELFRKGLRGLAPDGSQDTGFHGRELTRNAAVGDHALATGMRLQEFTFLLPWEIPALPPEPTAVPIPFSVPAGITKGKKFRTTWTSYEALAGLHDYVELDRAATTDGSLWRPPRRWGEPLMVTDPDARGGLINGVRRPWESLTPAERRRLVAPEGGSCLLAVKNGGGPFTAWGAVFERTSDRIRARFEPRFPHVWPHRCRHTFSMRTLEYLVTGHYRQAAKLVRDTEADAALVFYLSKADPLLVLRDLLGHSTVLTTEKYLKISHKRKREAVNVMRLHTVDRRGRSAPMASVTAYEARSVAVPFGNCTEPSNVKAGGKACPIRFQCAACPSYRPDPSYLPAIEDHVRSLKADKEMAVMMEADEFVVRNLDDQIAAFKGTVETMRKLMEAMNPDEREDVEHASAVLRKVRAVQGHGSAVSLGMPGFPGQRGGSTA